MESFGDIWGHGRQWASGRDLLSKIVCFLEDRSLMVAPSDDPDKIDIVLPLPKVEDHQGGEVCISSVIPEDLRTIFNDRYSEIVWTRIGDDLPDLTVGWRGGADTDFGRLFMNNCLLQNELMCVRAGEPTLSQIAASAFGLSAIETLKTKMPEYA